MLGEHSDSEGTRRNSRCPGRCLAHIAVARGWPEQSWGLTYAGWTADLERVVVPEIFAMYEKRWSSGDVYVKKLHHGQRSSDSVRRLQQALNELSDAGLPVTGSYLDLIDAAVRRWQARAGLEPDPVGHSFVSVELAASLFTQPPFASR